MNTCFQDHLQTRLSLNVPLQSVHREMVKSALRYYGTKVIDVNGKVSTERTYSRIKKTQSSFNFYESDLTVIIDALSYSEKMFKVSKKQIEAKYYRELIDSFILIKRISTFKEKDSPASESARS
ncbi:hypothetical protein ACJ2A9_09710 [Anaerobacillus sp. MEB173]|uniref:hypothetical protein n=1 Tax=Anaerobacillus sp. MEB173 TaxID=3383345 RepID=UPI003F93F5E0